MGDHDMNGVQTIGLLDVEPDLRAYLTPDERQVVARVSIPVHRFSVRSLDLDTMLQENGAFGAVILDGVLLHRLSIGDQPALRLLGPGDMLSRSGAPRTALLGQSGYRTTGPLRLAMFDDRFLLAARRFPRLFAGLQIRQGEQHQRLAAQLVICQLPRVEDRLLALMWLLAETWGRVTASGTVLPIALTHDALGELIGARRPTVTLALKELAERGSLFRQDGEWLLLEPPPQAPAPGPARAEPTITLPDHTHWADDYEPAAESQRLDPTFRRLEMVVSTLRESHVVTSSEIRGRLEQSRRTREQLRALREQIARERELSRPRPAPVRSPAP